MTSKGEATCLSNSGAKTLRLRDGFSLFGDAGNDRIAGASGDDVIVGGIGNDRMHGGGGSDIFTFCDNWGTDEVKQLADGSVTLWFVSGNESNWNAETLIYMDGLASISSKSPVGAEGIPGIGSVKLHAVVSRFLEAITKGERNGD